MILEKKKVFVRNFEDVNYKVGIIDYKNYDFCFLGVVIGNNFMLMV